ncbi:MAG: DNA repair protein RecO [Clostridiales bacterium]|nr:DNA repair protein RecO [Clostridiales bacterium]
MGSTFKDKGIVIKESPAGERDKRLTLLLLERGRTTVLAKGAGNPASKFHASAQLMAFSEFVMYEGSGFMTVAQATLTENFYRARTDLERLCCASHVIEIAEKVIMQGMDCRDALRLIYLTLRKIAGGDVNPRLAAAVFEIKFYQLEGFAPAAGRCCVCHGSIYNDGYFLPEGTACPACGEERAGSMPFSAGAVSVLCYILESDVKDIFKFGLSANPQRELINAMTIFREGVLDSPPKSLDILEGC